MRERMMQVNFEQQMLMQAYEKVHGLGDRLVLMKNVVDWEKFRPIIARIFRDNEVVGGRPHTDEVLIAKLFTLQSLYDLSDEELEFMVTDRLSFRNFLDFPEKSPDFSTIWKIRERLKEKGTYQTIWDELQRQLDEKGYKAE